tara:strand:+ start:1119 stop:1583 length:465 start_codon:yes stop_codon:yes gene_type:complete
MKLLLALSLVCVVALLGCATTYRGVYWVRSEAVETEVRKQQAIAVRNAVLRVSNEVGFTVEQSDANYPDSLLTSLFVGIPKEGLKEPYKSLGGMEPHVWLSVSFAHPFSIVISDIGNSSESELVRRIKTRLEAELAKVKPSVTVSYRIDRMRLD